MRETVKGIIERALVASGVAAVAKKRLSRSLLILAYHNIVPDDVPRVGDLPNHLPLSKFRQQLDVLQASHDIVSLDDVLREPASSRPRVAITFDDAYAGAVRHGIEELAKRGLPATIFVAPAFVGGRSFWWDALSSTCGGALDAHFRSKALQALRGEDTAIRSWAERHGYPCVPVPELACAASKDELHSVDSVPGITLGSHTWSHPNLTCLDIEEMRAELTRPLKWLRRHFDSWLPWIAYPYGHFDEAVASTAADVGYHGGLAITGGWFATGREDRFSLPRLNIPPGLSAAGFKLRAAGLGA